MVLEIHTVHSVRHARQVDKNPFVSSSALVCGMTLWLGSTDIAHPAPTALRGGEGATLGALGGALGASNLHDKIF